MLFQRNLIFVMTISAAMLCGAGEDMDPSVTSKASVGDANAKPAGTNPLLRVIEYATTELERAELEIKEYSCLLIKRQRVDQQLTERQYIDAKVRRRRIVAGKLETPLAIYLKFLKPSTVKGREVLYVEGERRGDLLAKRGGPRLPNLTVELNPTGRYAMRDNLHPITEFGFVNLVVRLVESMREDLPFENADVQFFDHAKLGDRECKHIQVTHLERREYFDYHLARIFIDKELGVPTYFARYDWPTDEDAEPPLTEEYIFTRIKLNPGFSSMDFDASNPEYGFQEPQSLETIAVSEVDP